MFRLLFYSPRIAPNTGNAIRMVAATGCELHLVEPLGFDLSEPKLRRAGLDYHDLASVTAHTDESLELATTHDRRPRMRMLPDTTPTGTCRPRAHLPRRRRLEATRPRRAGRAAPSETVARGARCSGLHVRADPGTQLSRALPARTATGCRVPLLRFGGRTLSRE